MFGLFQDTPQYAGKGRPSMTTSTGGLFGFLGGLFGGSTTPTYAKAPDSSSGASASTAPTQAMDPGVGCDAMIAEPACTVPLPIAIVVQRPEQ
jgi:hypothetical protein